MNNGGELMYRKNLSYITNVDTRLYLCVILPSMVVALLASCIFLSAFSINPPVSLYVLIDASNDDLAIQSGSNSSNAVEMLFPDISMKLKSRLESEYGYIDISADILKDFSAYNKDTSSSVMTTSTFSQDSLVEEKLMNINSGRYDLYIGINVESSESSTNSRPMVLFSSQNAKSRILSIQIQEQLNKVESFYHKTEGIYNETYAFNKSFKSDSTIAIYPISINHDLLSGAKIPSVIVNISLPSLQIVGCPESINEYMDKITEAIYKGIVNYCEENNFSEIDLESNIPCIEFWVPIA